MNAETLFKFSREKIKQPVKQTDSPSFHLCFAGDPRPAPRDKVAVSIPHPFREGKDGVSLVYVPAGEDGSVRILPRAYVELLDKFFMHEGTYDDAGYVLSTRFMQSAAFDVHLDTAYIRSGANMYGCPQKIISEFKENQAEMAKIAAANIEEELWEFKHIGPYAFDENSSQWKIFAKAEAILADAISLLKNHEDHDIEVLQKAYFSMQ